MSFGFRVTVTSVSEQPALPVLHFPDGNPTPATPAANGEFVIVYLTATNVGNKPMPFGLDPNMLIDAQGKEYDGYTNDIFADGQLGQPTDYLNPGVTEKGYLAYDVSKTVVPAKVTIQPDRVIGSTNVPTTVTLTK